MDPVALTAHTKSKKNPIKWADFNEIGENQHNSIFIPTFETFNFTLINYLLQ